MVTVRDARLADKDSLHNRFPTRSPAVTACGSRAPRCAASNVVGALAQRRRPPRTMPPSDASDVDAMAAYRVLLCHVPEMATQRYLARAACVCVAWRNEAHADAHNATMRFDKDGPHVVHALRRCAAVVQELHVPLLLYDLPAGVCFPRLTLVNEYALVADVVARAPTALAALRVAPRLHRWLLRGCADAVPAARSKALQDGIDAERVECCLGLRCCIPAVAKAMRGLLPPARHDVDVHACVTSCSPPAGTGVLFMILDDLPSRQAVTTYESDGWFRHEIVDAFYARQHSYISSRMETLLQPVPVGARFRNSDLLLMAPPTMRAAQMDSAVEWRHTLLHQAVASASLGAAAVLLRAGADPMQPPDGAAEFQNAVNLGGSALSLAVAAVSELLLYADQLGVDDGGGGAWLVQLAVRLAPARRAAPHAVAMLWLLGRAAVARHGAEAVEITMLPAVLAVLHAAPHAVPGLAANGCMPSFGVARAARALLLDAEVYVAAGDDAAAQRAASLRLTRAVACTALVAAPIALLVAAVMLALFTATIVPLAAVAAPYATLVLAIFLLARVSKAAVHATMAAAEAFANVITPVWKCLGDVGAALFITPLRFMASGWCFTFMHLIELGAALCEASSRG